LISLAFIALVTPTWKMFRIVRIVIRSMFLSGFSPNFKILLDALGWLSQVMNTRLFSYYLELIRAMLHPSKVCRELRLLPKDIGSFQRDEGVKWLGFCLGT